jgi:hypothetical protein
MEMRMAEEKEEPIVPRIQWEIQKEKDLVVAMELRMVEEKEDPTVPWIQWEPWIRWEMPWEKRKANPSVFV